MTLFLVFIIILVISYTNVSLLNKSFSTIIYSFQYLFCLLYTSTRRIVHHIGQFLSQSFMVPVIDTDLTSFNKRQNNFEIPSTSFVVFGMPTYAGKLPNKIMPFIREHVHGNQTNVLAIVTFGNRNFDHALAELCLSLIHI